MQILILGSTGGTGRELVRQGLDRGYTVTAFARRPEALDLDHENLVKAAGDILDKGSLEAAIMNQDAVLSALGVNAFRQTTVLSDGTKNIIQAMEQYDVVRFIVETAIGVGQSKQQLSPVLRFLMLSIFLRNVYIDKERQEEVIKESDLDWTIVRPAGLTDNELTKEYKVTEPTASAPVWAKISRADVAHFMLNQIEEDTWLHKAPSLFY